MNYALPTLLMLSLNMNACAQKVSEADVPQPVKAAFTAQFPKAAHVRWDLEPTKDYEANFTDGGTERSANYDPQGKWLETETEIRQSELPAPVSSAVAAQYADHKVKEVSRVETVDGRTVYEVEMKKGDATIEVQFDPAGKVVGTKAVDEDEDGEEDEKN